MLLSFAMLLLFLRRYASEADTVETLINAPRVKTWRLTMGRRQCVVKFTPAQRFMEAPDQVGGYSSIVGTGTKTAEWRRGILWQ